MITLNDFSNLTKTASMQAASVLSSPPLNLNSSSLQQQPLKADTFEKQQGVNDIDIIKDRKKKNLKRFVIETGVFVLALLVIKNGKKIFDLFKNVFENNKTPKVEIIPTLTQKSQRPPIRRALTCSNIIDVEGYSIK